MNVKKMILLTGALGVAGFTAFLTRSLLADNGTANAAIPLPVVEAKGPKVLVAKKDLPAGTLLDNDSFTYQPWPKDLLDQSYFTDDNPSNVSNLAGKVVRVPLTKGQPITQSAIVGPGERGFLAAALGPGMRAVTVPITDTSGVGGFVFPGDRVDLVLTQQITSTDSGEPLKVAETILRNLRVLAVDQNINTPNAGQANVARSITFEVTPKYAEKIAVAQSLGTLSLSLRSLEDSASEIDRAIANGEVEIPEGSDKNGDRALLMSLANKPSDNNPTYTTGGEASRFARNNMPSKEAVAKASAPPPLAPVAPPPPPKKPPTIRVARGSEVAEIPVEK